MPEQKTATAEQAGASDELLLADVREGKLDSFGVLYERYVSMARAVAIKHTSDPVLSDDIVSEAFVRILQALKNGKGPRSFMGGYLATTIAHLAAENGLIKNKEVPSEEEHLEAMGSLDDTVLRLHDSDELITAFTSLPERWQTVLWMTEVEAKKPREVAMSLNLSANAVSALATRARESLREGFLKAHQSAPKTYECEQYSSHLSSMVRGSLTKKRSEALRTHLATCSYCTSEYLTLAGINKSMRVWVFPVLAGLLPVITDSSRVLVPFLTGGAAVGGGAVSVSSGGFNPFGGKLLPKNPALAGVAAVTALAAVAGGVALVNSSSSDSPTAVSAESQPYASGAETGSDADAGERGSAATSAASRGETGGAETGPQEESASTTGLGRAQFASAVNLVGANGPAISTALNTGSTPAPATPAGGAPAAGLAAGMEATSLSSASAGSPVSANLGERQNQNSLSEAVAPAGAPAGNETPAPLAPVTPAEQEPLEPLVPSEPEDPVNPAVPEPTGLEPVAPSDPEPVTPVEPVEPEPVEPDPELPPNDVSDPVDPVEPVEPVVPEPDPELPPIDSIDPVEPVEPVEPVVPEPDPELPPIDSIDPVEPIDPVDPDLPPVEDSLPEDPKDWIGTPAYYGFMDSVPWENFGKPVAGNLACTIYYTVDTRENVMSTYIPTVVLEHRFALFILEAYFEVPQIDMVMCYSQ